MSFFKIATKEPITFGWTQTYIIATPTSLTVKAVANGYTFPVGPNTDGTIPGAATQVVWDVYSYAQSNKETPLVQGMYQLQIYDERGPGSARKGGYLTPNQNLQFGLYTPKGYTALGDGWRCAACKSGAISDYTVGSPLFMSLMVTFLVMVLSGFSLVRRRD